MPLPLFSDASDSFAPRDTSVSSEMTAKELGAYYTDSQIADRLVEWAIRSQSDVVADPSFGGGVFLRAAARRIAALGGTPSSQVRGVEIDQTVHGAISGKLEDEFHIERTGLMLGDFFDLPHGVLQVDCILGNPPFIRFHRFCGSSRERALARAAECGVTLSRLASSWAPFLVHAISMIRTGGRLAMVVPAELTHASYGAPVLRHIAMSFRDVSLLSFKKKLFSDLSEDTYLLLAEGRGEPHERFRLEDFEHIGNLRVADSSTVGSTTSADLDATEIAAGRLRLVEHFLEPRVRELYAALKKTTQLPPLGMYADVGIGYVSGANDFFHMSPTQAQSIRVPAEFLKRAVLKGRGLRGLKFEDRDWTDQIASGTCAYLLAIPTDGDTLTGDLAGYLSAGESEGIHNGYKCRNRKPWFSVPHVYVPDAFVTYMSGNSPKLVVNHAGSVAPNTLHVLRMRSGHRERLNSLAVGWHSSLTRLSLELEGHAMGGGMLKIEPTEAERIRVPMASTSTSAQAAQEIDSLLRNEREPEARMMADQLTLREVVGLGKLECELLSNAAEQLRLRRTMRGAA